MRDKRTYADHLRAETFDEPDVFDEMIGRLPGAAYHYSCPCLVAYLF